MDKQKKLAMKKLKKDLQKKVGMEKETFSKVLELISEESVNEEKLISYAPWLNPGNYSDIVEERFSMKLCGYILCPNKLVNIPKHKYHISVATKQVFDLSERKKFCCNQCFKESEFFASQLSEEPIWERDLSAKPDIRILTNDAKKVSTNICNEDNLSVDDSEKRVLKVHEKNAEVNNEGIHIKNISEIIETTPLENEPISPHPSTPPLEDCCKVVSAWLTNRTLDFLIKAVDNRDFFDGIPVFPKLTEQLKERLEYKFSNQPSDSDDVSSDDTLSDNDELSKGKYVSCSTMDKMQAIFTKHAKSPTSPKGGLPSIGSLDSKNIPDIRENADKPDVVLPMVDSVSQANMRCNIVLEKLNTVIPVVTKSLQIMVGAFWQDLSDLVKTFRLTQYNISFKKIQWQFFLIILMYFISLVNAKVKNSIDDERNHTEFITPLIEHWEDPTLLKNVALIHG